nr:MAG TPA: hypothetical protein [Caudoviricetes sp.]
MNGTRLHFFILLENGRNSVLIILGKKPRL